MACRVWAPGIISVFAQRDSGEECLDTILLGCCLGQALPGGSETTGGRTLRARSLTHAMRPGTLRISLSRFSKALGWKGLGRKATSDCTSP
jgi:hypothetical protein